MKHITYADKSLLAGDEVADTLIQYAKALADHGRTDTVNVRAIGVDGNDVEATFLLNAASVLMVETATTTADEPDNTDALRYLQDRLEELTTSHPVQPEDPNDPDRVTGLYDESYMD